MTGGLLLEKGSAKLRKDFKKTKNEKKLTVNVLIVTRDGFALAVKRAPDKTHAETWSLPGGSVDKKEKPLWAAARETWEEIGFQLWSTEPIYEHTRKSNKHTFRYYLAIVDSPFDAELDHEHIDYDWIDLKKNGWPDPAHPRIEKMLKKVGTENILDVLDNPHRGYRIPRKIFKELNYAA